MYVTDPSIMLEPSGHSASVALTMQTTIYVPQDLCEWTDLFPKLKILYMQGHRCVYNHQG